MHNSPSANTRKNFMEIGQIYFWTATINSWIDLLKDERYKKVIIDSLQYLTSQGKIDVFAFVIMPTHFHLIWRINEQNGRETTAGSLLKYTAHQFKKQLLKNELARFKVEAQNKNYEFWQRDSLAVHLYSPKVAYQKLEYIHANPITGRWNLATEPADYIYSSASFYDRDEKIFSFLKDLREEF